MGKKACYGIYICCYGESQNTISKSFKSDNTKYHHVFQIINKHWECQLHRPLHVAGHYLNPKYIYSYPEIGQDRKIVTGLHRCIERLVKNIEAQDKISDELIKYREAEGTLGIKMTIRHRNLKSVGK